MSSGDGTTGEAASSSGQGSDFDSLQLGNHPDKAELDAWVARNSSQLGINYDGLPRMPFFAPAFGFSQSWYKQQVVGRVMLASKLVGRPLEPPEQEAVSYHGAKIAATRAWEPPLALLVAVVAERRGRGYFRFPFWTPRPSAFDPHAFPSPRAALLRGKMAWNAWHTLRFGLYAYLSHLGVAMFLSTYALSVWLAHMRTDPRLAAFRDVMKERAVEAQRQRVGEAGEQHRRPGQQGPPFPMGRRPIGQQPQGEQTSSQGQDAYSSSPYSTQSGETGGAESAQSDGWSKEYDQEGQQQSDEASQQRQRSTYRLEVPRQPTRQGPVPYGRRHEEATPSSGASAQGDDETGLFDDASPAYQQKQTDSSRSGASAWDRIRNQSRGERGESAGAAPYSSQGGGGGQDSSDYSYAQADVDKAYAKEQAQKEFDAMLDKERQGESDDSGKGKGRWW